MFEEHANASTGGPRRNGSWCNDSPWNYVRLVFAVLPAVVLCSCMPQAEEAAEDVAAEPPAAMIEEVGAGAVGGVGGGNDDAIWQGLERHSFELDQTLLLVKGSKGIIACPYLNIETFRATGEACAIISAPQFVDMPGGEVAAVTAAAEALGITVGMSGREALERIR